ncbi:VOC family protein [soil metagenome]
MATAGPDFVALQVRDLESSATFYEDHVGLTRAPDSPPGAVVFATQPIPFAVREPLVDLDAVDQLGWGIALWMACDDADALCQDLRDAAVTIAAAPTDSPFGRTFAFIDPDGYRIVMHDG